MCIVSCIQIEVSAIYRLSRKVKVLVIHKFWRSEQFNHIVWLSLLYNSVYWCLAASSNKSLKSQHKKCYNILKTPSLYYFQHHIVIFGISQRPLSWLSEGNVVHTPGSHYIHVNTIIYDLFQQLKTRATQKHSVGLIAAYEGPFTYHSRQFTLLIALSNRWHTSRGV